MDVEIDKIVEYCDPLSWHWRARWFANLITDSLDLMPRWADLCKCDLGEVTVELVGGARQAIRETLNAYTVMPEMDDAAAVFHTISDCPKHNKKARLHFGKWEAERVALNKYQTLAILRRLALGLADRMAYYEEDCDC